MGKLKCIECGQIFNDNLNECPNCGCPASECEKIEENYSNNNVKNEDFVGIHNSFNEKPHYSPFSSNSSFFKDPALLAKYPLGEFEKKHPFWGWFFGPWHLTCNDESSREQYDVINNIFYAFNLIWKSIAYAFVWTILKVWVLILITIGLFFLVISNSEAATLLFLFPFLYAYYAFIFFFGIGKSLHRYWPQFHKVFRKLCKRFVNSMRQ